MQQHPGLVRRTLHWAGVEDFDIFLALLAGLLSLLLVLKKRRDDHIEFIRPTPPTRPAPRQATATTATGGAPASGAAAEHSDSSRPPATAPPADATGAPTTTLAAAAAASAAAGEPNDNNTCVVCMDNPRDVLLMPCAHMVLCRECAVNLRDCPTCRTKIRQQVQVYS
ncbi:hypothetical protein JKP88DRAFT_225620 [Tribonema minus]|uniref:RING-type domain-containing protein n=1 Tax=Tribonema minus TaxID=303371 RepID=A0A836CAR3_9STRA|nr:hypothetical protein JKP88DRAFT_225620 [Tribonema minus]